MANEGLADLISSALRMQLRRAGTRESRIRLFNPHAPVARPHFGCRERKYDEVPPL
jgi:hypothetical protein